MDQRQLLEELKGQTLQSLSSMSAYLANDESLSYDMLIVLARNTGNVSLLQTALKKVQAIEDERQRSDGLLAVLSAIEESIGDLGQSQQPPAPTEDNSPAYMPEQPQ